MQESQSTLPTLQFKAGTRNNIADNITASLHRWNAINVTQDISITTITKKFVKLTHWLENVPLLSWTRSPNGGLSNFKHQICEQRNKTYCITVFQNIRVIRVRLSILFKYLLNAMGTKGFWFKTVPFSKIIEFINKRKQGCQMSWLNIYHEL